MVRAVQGAYLVVRRPLGDLESELRAAAAADDAARAKREAEVRAEYAKTSAKVSAALGTVAPAALPAWAGISAVGGTLLEGFIRLGQFLGGEGTDNGPEQLRRAETLIAQFLAKGWVGPAYEKDLHWDAKKYADQLERAWNAVHRVNGVELAHLEQLGQLVKKYGYLAQVPYLITRMGGPGMFPWYGDTGGAVPLAAFVASQHYNAPLPVVEAAANQAWARDESNRLARMGTVGTFQASAESLAKAFDAAMATARENSRTGSGLDLDARPWSPTFTPAAAALLSKGAAHNHKFVPPQESSGATVAVVGVGLLAAAAAALYHFRKGAF